MINDNKRSWFWMVAWVLAVLSVIFCILQEFYISVVEHNINTMFTCGFFILALVLWMSAEVYRQWTNP